jgi:alpha-beta hydrolase superfamily lysophospholipase
MAADLDVTPTPRDRLWREFAARATTDPVAWRARTWARAVLMTPGGADDDVLAVLSAEWAEFRTTRPGEPDVAFRPPPAAPEEAVVPGPPPYAEFAPLARGRYGTDLPAHEDRVREEGERLARRDQAYYGF